ncbi:MAG: putative membrane-bound dehydrogenase-like protein [Candidatus Promineifilaceae bacterium]
MKNHQRMKSVPYIAMACFCMGLAAVSASDAVTPRAHDASIAGITLFADTPDIVTPVGIAVAPDGRVFVQENHTHQRPGNYVGPESDRILVFEDNDNDGVADKRSVFYEGGIASTDLLFGPDGHLYVATRSAIVRFLDAASHKVAEGAPQVLVRCDTTGDYPHNGVGGLAIDPAHPEWLAFGFGENLGAAYTFIGSDGITWSGGGEGGSTYRCRTDGSALERVATGIWNAFGMGYDLEGHLFATDNDPNSTPPNRLLHVVAGADFGYEYCYGRSGRHPLVSWYGEIPGTLGMSGALGEAACGVVPYGPKQLLTASWTDNRVDVHPLAQHGATFAAGRKPFVSGPFNFRPVHLAYTADGRHLYISDWVSSSYAVHGKGRIWRVAFKEPVDLVPRTRPVVLAPTPATALKNLADPDPYVRTEAIRVLVKHPNVLTSYNWQGNPSSVARAHYAVARKRLDAEGHTEIIPALLKDVSETVRFVGIKWIADERLSAYKALLEQHLARADMSRRNLMAVVAALDRVNGESRREFSPSATLLGIAQDTSKPAALRALALSAVSVDHRALTVSVLAGLANESNSAIQREAIHSLVIHKDAARASALATLAGSEGLDPNLRADAIAGLAAFAAEHDALLVELSGDANTVIAAEVKRSRAAAGLAKRPLLPKPSPDDLAAWEQLLAGVKGKPDTRVGRRLFFHPRMGACYQCHGMNGRGLAVGPDLTAIRKQSGMSRQWLLKHVLDPNAAVAPYYRPQIITTRNGNVQMGFILGVEGGTQGYVGSDGKVFYVKKHDITQREELPVSLMPPGLLNAMSASEIRDLLAFLLKGRE